MLELFHVNGHGVAGRCTAGLNPDPNGLGKSRGCPFGSLDSHYTSLEDARMAFEESMEAEMFPEMKRESKVKTALDRYNDLHDIQEVEEEASFDDQTMGFDRNTLPEISTDSVKEAARDLMGAIFGKKSYDDMIGKATERADIAKNYRKSLNTGKPLNANLVGYVSPASASTKTLTENALASRRENKVGSNRAAVASHGVPSSTGAAAREAFRAADSRTRQSGAEKRNYTMSDDLKKIYGR